MRTSLSLVAVCLFIPIAAEAQSPSPASALGVRFAQYDHISDDSSSEDIPSGNKSYRGWIMLGARGAFTL